MPRKPIAEAATKTHDNGSGHPSLRWQTIPIDTHGWRSKRRVSPDHVSEADVLGRLDWPCHENHTWESSNFRRKAVKIRPVSQPSRCAPQSVLRGSHALGLTELHTQSGAAFSSIATIALLSESSGFHCEERQGMSVIWSVGRPLAQVLLLLS